jgi:signal transduction histidine kinase
MINLLSNSIKYTAIGSIKIKVCEIPLNKLMIQVIDTGVGLNQENLAKIFDQFIKI